MRVSRAGVFDAQPTASERQRENLSSRLRREFGLALPDDEDARAHTGTHTDTNTYVYTDTDSHLDTHTHIHTLQT